LQHPRTTTRGKNLINGVPGTDKVLFDSAMSELNELIGLQLVKQQIRELYSFIKVSKARQDKFEKPAFTTLLHRIYKGPPGTGKKTTVAKNRREIKLRIGTSKERAG